jgi:hypothetical protein
MSKTKFTYVVMILVFALGLWAILRAGSHLRAVPDVAGEWAVTWFDSRTNAPARMTVNQSGRFVNATLTRADHGEAVKLRGTLERSGTSRADLTLKAVNEPLAMTATYDQSSRMLTGTTEGSVRWHASRVPKDSPR